MKLAAIALDYDGTIAIGDRIDPSIRDAVRSAREAGVTVLLSTGRILRELQRVAGDLHFTDVVIAENGAVVHFPDTGHTSVLAPRVPDVFITELVRAGVPFSAGDCLVDTDACEAHRVLDVLRATEQPLVLVFNRGRLMTMAQGISKATGLQAALRMLRLSARNMVAIGDAENDHEMLRLAEVGTAVEWGSAALQRAADDVVRGTGPSAVAEYVRRLVARQRLPTPARARRRLRLGFTEDGREFSLAVKGRNVLIAGDAKTGKSWIAGLLCEQLILHGYSVCVLDPEGDYTALERLPGVTVLGGDDALPTPRDILRALRYPDRSLIIDLSRQPHDRKVEYIRAALPALKQLRARSGLPHRIVVDEAHYFLHDEGSLALLDLERAGYTIVTYCASRLPLQVLAAAEVMISTCESNPAEVEALYRRCRLCQAQLDLGEWATLLGSLRGGQAVALPITEEAEGTLRVFEAGERLTPHVRHRQKYVDVPVPDQKAFVFAGTGAPARTLRGFLELLTMAPAAVISDHVRRHDFSRWISDVFGDHPLATELRRVETSAAEAIETSDLVAAMANLIRGRYDVTEPENRTTAQAA